MRRSRKPLSVVRRIEGSNPSPSATKFHTCDDRPVKNFTVTIEGSNWTDVQELELLDLPKEGDTVETRYGTCIVTESELLPDSGERAGKIVCRLP
jgi:hypothetical protein